MPDNAIIQEIARILDAPIMTTTLPHEAHEDIEYCTDPELIDENSVILSIWSLTVVSAVQNFLPL